MFCLVWEVWYYLQHTKATLVERKKLFLAYKAGHTGKIQPNTISSWLRKQIF